MSRLLLALILGLALTACPTENLPIYDFDGDGFTDETDCVVDDDSIFPGAPDAYGDGIDQNCDGADGTDVDGDGFASEGGDCRPVIGFHTFWQRAQAPPPPGLRATRSQNSDWSTLT